MAFFKRIFVVDKPLVFTSDKEKLIRDYPVVCGYHFFPETTPLTINHAIKELSSSLMGGAVFEITGEAALKKILTEGFRIVEAGGGVVENNEGKILMIFRNGKWDLPKGKLEKGEDIETCALREVQEETGLKNITEEKFLLSTFHFYALNKDRIIKNTHWYKMHIEGKGKLIPQKEEGITEAKWVAVDDLEEKLKNSFPAIRLALYSAGLVTNDR